MKKTSLLAAGLVALGLGIFCACTEETPGSGVDDGGDNGSTSSNYVSAMGSFAEITWISQDGLLDLANSTFEGASSFEVTNVEGTVGDGMTIYCTADDVDYTLTLNDYGALEMRTTVGDELERTFMASATYFAGTWYDEDGTDGYYYVISSNLDDDGYFSWQRRNQSGVSTESVRRAVTVFETYEDDTAGMYFGVLSEDDETVIDIYYYFSSSTVYMEDGSALGSTAVTAYSGAFSTTYRNSDGDELTIDINNSIVTYAETECEASPAYDQYGAGIWFYYDSEYYALIQMIDSTYLINSSGVEEYAPYDSEWLPGETSDDGYWMNGSGLIDVYFSDDETITFNGTDYSLEKSLDSGDTVYTFYVNSTALTIRPVDGTDDVFTIETTVSRYSGYYFRNSSIEIYFDTFTNNSEDLTVDEDLTITSVAYSVSGDEVTSATTYYTGTFTYISDLGATAISYSPFGEGGATLYFTIVNSEGIYWSIAGGFGSYMVYSTYFTLDYEEVAIDSLTAALGDDDVYFTTGGINPDIMQFDFEQGIVWMNDTAYCFTWGYGYITSTSEPELYIMLNGDEVETDIGYDYDRYTLYISSLGILAEFTNVSVDESSGSVTPSDDVVESFYVAQSLFESLIGSQFVYDGQFTLSTISIGEDGALNLSVYDYDDDTTDLIKVMPYDYTIDLTVDSSGNEIITLTYEMNGEEYSVVITNRLYATYNSLTYCIPDLAEVIGTYNNDEDGYITLTSDGRMIIDGTNVTVKDISTQPGSVIIEYSYQGSSYTATFNGETVTISDGSTYNYKIQFTPEKFVGTFNIAGVDSIGDVEIVVSSVVSEINQSVSLVVTVNGTITSTTFTYVDGKQQLSFYVRDFATFVRINCVMVLDGEALTVTVNSQSESLTASDWSYSDFIIEDEGTLTCVVKDGVPLYTLNGELCDSYTVTVDSDGVKTLQLTFGTSVVTITNTDGDIVTDID